MATLLYRLGRFSFRRRRFTLAIWMTVLALLGVGSATLSGPTTGEFTIPGSESSRALDVLAEKFGSGSGGAEAKVVFTSGTAMTADGLAGVVAELKRIPQVAAVADPVFSADQRTAYAAVSYSVAAGDVTTASRDALLAVEAGEGVGVAFSGEATRNNEESHAAETIGIAVAALVLVITFGSLVAAGLPLLTAMIGVGAGMLAIQIATGFFDLSSSTSALATMLGLAVGIDYALFVVSRYRHELAEHDDEEAAGRAVGTAGSAVVFAGLTVVIALAALSVTGIPFLTAMGLAAAGTVAVAVLVTLTFVPAVLGFAGRRLYPRPARKPGAPFGERWARGVLRHRWVALVVSLGVIGAVAIPATDLRLALPDDSTAAVDSTQRRAYDQLALGFGPGFNGPLILVADAGVAAAAQQAVSGLSDVVMVTPPVVAPSGDTAMLTVIPASAPTSEATKQLVHDIRALGIASLAVTGTTAINIDVSDRLTSALIPYLAIVVGLAFVLLMLVFRSILVPIKATVGFLLSVAAAFGALVAVFQNGHLAGLIGLESTGPIVSIMPIFLIGILFGLAMDYEVFLVTRTREEFVHGAEPNPAIISGMRHGARVVTAAALIMMSVFAGFILADDTIIKSLGFALAFGVAVDAFLVRMTIVPAVLSLLGRSAWWLPRWLDRLLPDVDVEGSSLTIRQEEPPAEVQELAAA
ncbi:membrane protein [Actinoplanes italicus]|uniref:RND superfamily putative drug exporter n=1 Tax=Actinoplanes italicus TaxID=113567 RepID=A0A2T0KQJ5_9ACTN|nr:MMPL family transporter [Actinoplanes italicus]PRX26000.1 RND superfamily putative drug exporter [Actinoplanes italicus]GIE33584.1 membrane protein [Actinoplanes italicus]